MISEFQEKLQRFRPNGFQMQLRDAIRSRVPVVAVVGGWGCGKTTSVVFEQMDHALARPGRTILNITDTSERYNNVQLPEMDFWMGNTGWIHRVRERRWVLPATGSTVITRPYFRPATRSSSHNPLEGINATANIAFIDEAQTMRPEVAQKALGRLRAKGYPPQLVIFGLPVWGAWWAELAEQMGGIVLAPNSMANAANLQADFFERAKEMLPTSEYRAMVLAEPQAPEGLVYSMWRPAAHPEGNLVPRGHWWRYQPHMVTRVAIDPGVEKPHALIICHDDDERWGSPDGVDIIIGEAGGERMAEPLFIRQILDIAWPRKQARECPHPVDGHGCPHPVDGDAQRPRAWLDDGVIDRAAKRSATSMRSPRDVKLQTVRDQMAKPATTGSDSGLGMMLYTPEGTRSVIVNGVRCVERWIEHRGVRRLLCLQHVWDQTGSKRTFRQSLQSYLWAPNGQPRKDGFEDPLDALRYGAVRWQWYSSPASDRATAAHVPTRAAEDGFKSTTWQNRGGGFRSVRGSR